MKHISSTLFIHISCIFFSLSLLHGCDDAPAPSPDGTAVDAAPDDAPDAAPLEDAAAPPDADAPPEDDALAAAVDAASGCTAPNPSGCNELGCPAGEICLPGGELPAGCTCDPALDAWSCERPTFGGYCKPACEVNQAPITCCRDGQPIAPLCEGGVFSCPEDTTARDAPACGAFERAAAPGLICGDALCGEAEGCCFNVNATTCYQLDIADGVQGCSGRVQCDDADACNGEGEVCCASFSHPDRRAEVVNRDYIESSCQPAAACVGPTRWPVCNSDADCGEGLECCRNVTSNPRVSLGLCAPGPC